MPRPRRFLSRHRDPRSAAPKTERKSGRYDAPGDPALELASIELNAPFAFDAAFGSRLARREVNPKEAFTVRDAAGGYFRASLKDLSPGGGTALAYEKMIVSPEPSIELTLACAIPARQRMIFVVQKATELGVSRIVPLLTQHSVPERELEHEKAHAWPGQVIRAVKQCRRSSLPELTPPTRLDDFLCSEVCSKADARLFLTLPSSQPSRQLSPVPRERENKIVLFCGPEGGFSPGEEEKLGKIATAWRLGGRVLRAETAVLVGLSAVQLFWGDFGRE